MKRFSIIFWGLVSVFVLFSSCKQKIGWTTVSVADSVRHYYPIIAGDILNLSYEIENTGEEPLIIREIQPSCGCIIPKLTSRMIMPGKSRRLLFKYESAKNIGFVEHVIRIHCNVKPTGIIKLVFDTNVVPHADYTRDYEELYKEAVERNAMIRGLVDGDETEKGYYVDSPSHDSREQNPYPWREEE